MGVYCGSVGGGGLAGLLEGGGGRLGVADALTPF